MTTNALDIDSHIEQIAVFLISATIEVNLGLFHLIPFLCLCVWFSLSKIFCYFYAWHACQSHGEIEATGEFNIKII